MYKILADDQVIYDSSLEDFVITKGSITKEVNKAGSFTFTILPEHPYYNRLDRLKTIITVYKDNTLVFRGRILTDSSDFYNQKTLTCEGELAFLLDSLQKPFQFTGSPTQFFTNLINEHNKQVDEDKQFIVGEITVTDNNDYITRENSKYESTSKNITDKCLDLIGGYLYVSRDDKGRAVINWYEDSPYASQQTIEFGENLLDFVQTRSAEDVGTAIVPLGAKIEDAEGEGDTVKITIESVNDGKNYVYDDLAVKKYGWIWQTVTWDDVTEPSNLLTKAKAHLSDSIKQNTTIELKAIDLAMLDQSIDSFNIFEYITVTSEPHNFSERMLLQKQSLDLLNSSNDKITLGYTYKSFTEQTATADTTTSSLYKRVTTIEDNYAIGTVVESQLNNLKSLIDQTSESIVTEISNSFVTNDKLTSEMSTVFTQLKDSFEYMFTRLETTIDDSDATAQAQINELKKYIRFEDGAILLGSSESDVTLKITNDALKILDKGTEMAYLQNGKLHVSKADITDSINMGISIYKRSNGNLSIGKVG